MTRRRKQLPPLSRILYFIVGLVIASILLVYSIRWEALPFRVLSFGVDITPYALASALVLTSIFAGTLIKSSLYGKWELD